MKKFIIISLAILASASAFAQSMDDAFRYSDVTYYGTARSMALGNAMTAVGGDLGSVTVNPAGSAVATYSQFTISPALSISDCTGTFYEAAGGNPGGSKQQANTRFNLPNAGIVLNMKTGASTGVKAFSFGLMVNMTSNYQDRAYSRGTNTQTTKCGALAVAAEGYNWYDIDMSLHPDENLYNKYPWPVVLGYNSGMISTESEDSPCYYIGATEANGKAIKLAGDIDQLYRIGHYGSKNDVLMNFGMNVSDQLYLGVNLGVPTFNYSEQIYFKESVFNDDWMQFRQEYINEYGGTDVVYFNNASYNYYTNAHGSGIYGKFGFIWTPVKGLRIGGAIQTPTSMTITENWGADASTVFTKDGSTIYNKYCKDNWVEGDNYTYRLRTPMRFNLGAAFTLARCLLVSFDWERMDARGMRYRDVGNAYSDYFETVNEIIAEQAGRTDEFRVGLEVKPFDFLSLRAGYDLKRTASNWYVDKTHMGSFGIGYSSNGPFYADFAMRFTKYPTLWYYPYEDYRTDVPSAETSIDKKLTDILLTFGVRF